MLAIVAVCVILLSHPQIFRFLDNVPNASAHRLDALDGLRGILAVSVVFHHLVIKRWALETGRWELPPSHFYSLLGQSGVAVFFMITGYLFWGRLIDNGGEIKWTNLYINRFFRIVPLYLLVVFSYIAVVLFRAHFQISIPDREFAMQLLQWLSFGMVARPLPLLGDTYSLTVTSQVWTLYYEWIFYFALPLLAVFAKVRSQLAVTLAALLIVLNIEGLIGEPNRYFVMQFLIGMFVASLTRTYPVLRGDGPVRSIVAVAAATCAFKFSDSAYSTSAVVFLGVFFLFVASGTSLFGLLTLRGVRRMGHMSYSIYLLHGLVLTIVMAHAALGAHAVISPEQFWVVALYTFAVVVIVAMASFRLVELRGIKLGKALVERRGQAVLQRF
ncbi:acyltransferase family protein [Paraburkholderia caribensis]|uniref:acyltransferase family protein n=1 Tax=Paraburkholderia caribensis TaxID=75105 RepID=UPI0015E6820F|nr:acyltransferase [Paraburkholderia caribensis]